MAGTTVNFTGPIDRDLLKRAKIVATKNDTSVNALLNALLNAQLRYLVETYEAGEAARNENYAALLAFSLGRLDDQAVMKKLGIDSEEDLFLRMVQAHLADATPAGGGNPQDGGCLASVGRVSAVPILAPDAGPHISASYGLWPRNCYSR